jgi:hypothetical protein
MEGHELSLIAWRYVFHITGSVTELYVESVVRTKFLVRDLIGWSAFESYIWQSTFMLLNLICDTYSISIFLQWSLIFFSYSALEMVASRYLYISLKGWRKLGLKLCIICIWRRNNNVYILVFSKLVCCVWTVSGASNFEKTEIMHDIVDWLLDNSPWLSEIMEHHILPLV